MKKKLRNTGKHLSRTPSAVPLIDGHGETLQQQRREWLEVCTNAELAALKKSLTEKRNLTTSPQSLFHTLGFKAGTSTQKDSSADSRDSKSSVESVMQSKLKQKTNKGVKFDQGLDKPPLAYIPKAALYAEGQAFAHGAKKYDAWNYRNGIAVTRTLSAAMRHISQFLDGEDVDEESGAHHLGCARANLAMALDSILRLGDKFDDRHKSKK